MKKQRVPHAKHYGNGVEDLQIESSGIHYLINQQTNKQINQSTSQPNPKPQLSLQLHYLLKEFLIVGVCIGQLLYRFVVV